MRKYLIVIFCAVQLLSCQEEGALPDTVAVGYNFFPLQLGDFRVYEVEEITHSSQGATVDSFQIRVDVVDSFRNQAGGITYVLSQFTRVSSLEEWKFEKTNSARLTGVQGIFIEGNVPFLKLSFPISAGKTWDSNALNALDEDLFEMDSLFSPYTTTRDIQMPQTLTVIQEDNQDFTVNFIKRHEIYGLDIGLVYSEDINLAFCIEESCLGQQIVENGKEIRRSLIDYGTEL
ncbi:hypothetical protein FNH22_24180 [Fulvivirga sp. M361]|uniref:hypothetical protein n=1 Tax=Fulvivirga sp. M361 TaxID=2594266 RepID=UPI00117B8228|nr:hypothetical protein [Fulvivirga sp. M361]TRX51392.1 hypothetical protein FNH22_24180 [Fulvivirga sp. M361]